MTYDASIPTPDTPLVDFDVQCVLFVRMFNFLTAERAALALGLSGETGLAAVEELERSDRIFSILFAGRRLYLADQFMRGEPRRIYEQIARRVKEQIGLVDGWTIVFFVCQPNSYLGGRLPLQDIAAESPEERTMELLEAYLQSPDVY
ncbi:MAG: hypothetical protein Q8Q73_06000 [Stagnimonas sp.]|nr:hypothetical protein [Stagnimonas sp.]